MSISMLIALAVIGPAEPDGVVSTAPRQGSGAVVVGAETPVVASIDQPVAQAITPHNLTTSEQIDRWIAGREPSAAPFSEAQAWEAPEARRVRGEVTAEIGTGGYRGFGAAVSMPIGDNAQLDLSFSQTRNGYGYGHVPGYDQGGWGRWVLPGRGRIDRFQGTGGRMDASRLEPRDREGAGPSLGAD